MSEIHQGGELAAILCQASLTLVSAGLRCACCCLESQLGSLLLASACRMYVDRLLSLQQCLVCISALVWLQRPRTCGLLIRLIM